MIKNKKLIYRILVVVVLLSIIGVGLFVTLNRSATTTDIIIRTDKNSYEGPKFANKYKVTLTNNLNEPIYLSSFALEHFQVKKDGKWTNLIEPMHGILPYISQSIFSHETLEIKPNPPLLIAEGIGEIKLPATLRFAVPIYFDCNGVGFSYKIENSCSNQTTIYSNEFTVYE